MPPLKLLLAFAISATLAFAQLESNSITVTASRYSSVQPDQVVFTVDVTSGLDTKLDDVIAALAGSGVTLANFNGTMPAVAWSGSLPVTTIIDWSFTLPVPISQIKATVASLSILQQSIAQKNNGLALSFAIRGTQSSPQVLQSVACSISDLMSDARAQAQKIANATGFTLGYVLSMSSFTTAPNCFLTVQFQLLRTS